MRDELSQTAGFVEALDLAPKAGARIAGRYELGEKLGAGGMSTVYVAHDHKDGRDVAIKFMKTDLGGSARRRFFREFNTIAGIQHPRCLQVYEIGETGETPYFSMELHPGRPVSSILGDPPEKVSPVLVDLTLAVDYIHSQGIVHRDIKPSNVMVQRIASDDGGNLSCKLADFGLAKFYQLDSSLTNERGLVGTPAYCAPEQIDGVEIDYRVDLYAVGILAFELLSGGRHPFSQARQQGVNALLHAHLAAAPPKLSDVNPTIPVAISDVVDSYLAKEPDLRPSSALPLRRVLCEHFGIAVDSRLEELSSPSEVKLNAVGFVCRDHELRQVDNFLQQRLAKSGNGKPRLSGIRPMLLFHGEPGAGKTSTMQEAVRRAIGLGYQVYEGRCLDGNATSFQPVVEIVRQILSSFSRSQRGVDESTLLGEYQTAHGELGRMNDILRSYQAELLLIAPELRRWLGGESHAPALHNDPEYLFRAFATMFVELSQITPLCLCFDDIQWAERSTLTFLQHLAAAIVGHCGERQTASSSLPLVVLCTGRSGYSNLDLFRTRLQSHDQLAEVELSPLDARETRELLALRLGCLASSITQELVESIHSLCQGNPFFISESIREWHNRGMIVRTTDGWQRVHASLDDESSLPSSVRSALRMRIADLSDPAQQILPAAALIGRIVDLDLLGTVLSDIGATAMLDAIDELLSKRVLVETHTASRIAFAHDLLRETVQSDLSANRRRALHRRIAQVLEEAGSEADKKSASPAVLAHHYLAGEMTDKAFRHLLDAAASAIRTFAFDDALDFLLTAEKHQPAEPTHRQLYTLYHAKTVCYLHKADTIETEQAGTEALKYAATDEERARTLLQLGRLKGVRRATDWSSGRFDEALKVLGLQRPKSRIMQLLSIQYSMLGFHCIPSPLLAILNRTQRRADKHHIGCEILYDLAHVVAFTDIIAYTEICVANVRLAKPLDDDTAKAFAYAKYGLNLGFSGLNAHLPMFNKSLAVRYGELGVACAQREGRTDLLSAVQTSFGFVCYCAGQLERAEKVLLEADKLLCRSMDIHATYCHHFLRHTYSVIGEPAKIIKASLDEHRVACANNDDELVGWANYGLAHGYALSGESEKALAAANESLQSLQHNDSNFAAISYMEQGFALMQASRYSEAVSAFRSSYRMMWSRLFFFEIAMPTFPRMVEAMLGPNWHLGKAAEGCDPRSAKKFARLAKFFAMSFPNIRPHTWRSLGRLEYASGKRRAARKCFERAIKEADKLGAKYELARTLIDSGVAFADLAERKSVGMEQLEALGAAMPEAELAVARV